jgi:hypothetical protein
MSTATRTARPKRFRETAEYAGMMSRMVKAFGKRVETGDIASLPLLAQTRDELDAVIDTTVRRLYLEHGYSWSEIGRDLGITRQAARQRYVHLVPERPADRRSGDARRRAV